MRTAKIISKKTFKGFFLGLLFFLAITILLFNPSALDAKLETTRNIDGEETQRSLESLRDLDYQTWQVVAYAKNLVEKSITLRIVGFPGSLRLSHPAILNVQSGIRSWDLDDITLQNSLLLKDTREAAAEFNLTPLLIDLSNNRPLRLSLKGGFDELPVPPYVVEEWRSLIENNLSND
ncbi:conserved hypothetical protein [Prochlorococcus marinus str. MIT 9211]|uniref:DUF3122 domain-containing protein n=1 Tax=Prochlorococcus marinus (strain MIT 9211) TaxID=93059 RepID=A9BBM8_PROM4|nr:conserved hypothetical protein [Prochlorococcus marinus str. MIT 9211]